MTDPDLDPPDPAEQRAVLRHIIGYRQLRRSIRQSGTGSLFWGLLMLGLWYVAFYQLGRAGTVLGMIHLALAAGELTAGVWKKLYPVPEAHLFDGLVLLGFAGANTYRVVDALQRGGRPSLFAIGFGVMMLLSAVQHFRTYRELRRARFRRPTGEQLRWFDELVAEARGADPEADPNSLDLPTRPPVRAKLLGDTALVVEPGGDDPAVVSRDGFRIDREPPGPADRLPVGYLTIDGQDAGDFPLDQANWNNYAAWKTAGGDPPPPLQAPAAGRE